ncbi:MAG: GAF domain-containing protein, partial [Rhodoferax sp.]|nr:GAF domain-containing protein [Rhodoferax sp.]
MPSKSRQPLIYSVLVFVLALLFAASLTFKLGQGLQLALAVMSSAALTWLVLRATSSRQQTVVLAHDLSSSQENLAALNQELSETLKALPDLMFELDLQGRYLKVHATQQRWLALPPEQFLGRTLAEVLPPQAAQTGMAAIQEADAQGFSLGQQIRLELADGPHWFELSVSRKAARQGASTTFLVLSRNITQRWLAEQKVERVSRMYAALSQCNQAIVHCQDKAELFGILCRDAVNFGGMRLAWIGEPDASAVVVRPVAWFGCGTDYLQTVDVSLDPANPGSEGPVGISMLEGRPYWVQDLQHDPSTAPWRARALQYGWAAVASLPLRQKGKVVGAFVVYSEVVDTFDPQIQSLLIEMAMDIGYALDRMVDHQERQQVQHKLLESEERYRAAFRT